MFLLAVIVYYLYESFIPVAMFFTYQYISIFIYAKKVYQGENK